MRWAVVLCVVVACGGGDPPVECEDGETRACYSGPPGSDGVGTCVAGVETCTDNEFNGICVGDVTPFVERCDGGDEDCNGTIDDVEGFGDECIGVDGCAGAMACGVDGDITCVTPAKNECGVCGGPSVAALGDACATGECAGVLVCNTAGDAATCNAPAINECGLCGGPPVIGLGDTCGSGDSCAGIFACNGDGDGTECDCTENLCNDAGTLRPIVVAGAGDLVITEVMPNPAQVADGVGEWFEVHVATAVDLNGIALDRATDSLDPEVITAFDCIPLAAGSTLVFAKSDISGENGGITAPITRTFGLSLIDGTVAAPGDVRLMTGATVIDAITWTSTRSGRSHQLDPDLLDAASNDSEAAFCDGTTAYGLGDLGTPNAANLQCPVVIPPGSCDDNGTIRPIVKPVLGQLVITEFLANPAAPPTPDGTVDADKEWFEIANVSAAAFDLNELALTRPGVTTPSVVTSAACMPLAAGAFALFARSADPLRNGGLPAVDATFAFALLDSGMNRSIQVLDGATELDSLTYSVAGSAASGRSMELDPDRFSPTLNDLADPTAGEWCQGTTAYGDGTNQGTPKATNAQCP